MTTKPSERKLENCPLENEPCMAYKGFCRWCAEAMPGVPDHMTRAYRPPIKPKPLTLEEFLTFVGENAPDVPNTEDAIFPDRSWLSQSEVRKLFQIVRELRRQRDDWRRAHAGNVSADQGDYNLELIINPQTGADE